MLHSVMSVHTMCNIQEKGRHHLYPGRNLKTRKVNIQFSYKKYLQWRCNCNVCPSLYMYPKKIF